MSDEIDEFEDDMDLPSQGTSSTKLLIIFGLLFVISNGIWGAVIFMKGGSAQAATAPAQDKKTDKKDEEDKTHGDKPGPVVALEPFVVNLNESDGGHYLRVTIKLEIDKEESRQKIDDRVVMIRDQFLTILSSKQLDELHTSEDKKKLREELLRAVREMLTARTIHAVYFTEFLTQ